MYYGETAERLKARLNQHRSVVQQHSAASFIYMHSSVRGTGTVNIIDNENTLEQSRQKRSILLQWKAPSFMRCMQGSFDVFDFRTWLLDSNTWIVDRVLAKKLSLPSFLTISKFKAYFRCNWQMLWYNFAGYFLILSKIVTNNKIRQKPVQHCFI